MTFELLPAVDVADGQAVRLVQGRAGSETTYGAPLAAALAWQSDGAEWIHLVDLDAAFEPRPKAASRSTRWIHSAPSACQASAAASGAP